jgi:SAM-dependent methyltransferase
MAAMEREEWNERYAGTELVWTATPNRFLVAEVEALRPGRALDLACGEGRNAVWLAERGWRVTGVDFADVALAKAARLAAARAVEVAWVDADVRTWEPPAGAFDLVVLLYLQLPAHERRAVHARAAAAVAPGGTLLVVAHHATNPAEGYGGPKDPAVLFTEDDVVADVRGLELERAERVRRPVTTPEGEEAVALDVLVRARRP